MKIRMISAFLLMAVIVTIGQAQTKFRTSDEIAAMYKSQHIGPMMVSEKPTSRMMSADTIDITGVPVNLPRCIVPEVGVGNILHVYSVLSVGVCNLGPGQVGTEAGARLASIGE